MDASLVVEVRKEMDDGELVGAVRAGNRKAFGTLVERYRQSILRLCYRVTGNLPDAEDLAHDAFVEAYLKLDQLREPQKFAPWLKMLALNLCRMWYRRSRRDTVSLSEELVGEIARGIADLTPLFGGLSRLSAAHRLALALHYGEELSYEEVAGFLDLPVGTVMSRLHRARRQLREILEQMRKDEEMTTMPEGDFGREVDAEIGALLQMSGESPEVRERLSALLRHSPQRFAALIRQAGNAKALDNLALLLSRVGRPAIEVALDCYLSSEQELRANAAVLLARFVGRGKPGAGDQPWARVAGRGIYLLLDIVFQAGAEDFSKAELLLDLLEVAPDERSTLLFLNALLCYRDAAFPLLIERFWSAATPEDLHRSSDLLHALCRTGTQFAAALLGPLRQSDARQQALALTGAEALARTLRTDWFDTVGDAREAWVQRFGHKAAPSPAGAEALLRTRSGDRGSETIEDDRVALEQRFRRKWALPLRKDRDPAVLEQLAEQVAAFVSDDRTELRNVALRTLGLLRSRAYLEEIRAALEHPEVTTRVTALRALADANNRNDRNDRNDRETGERMMRSAGSRDAAERRVAVECLGQLRVMAAFPLLAERVNDPDKQVRRAAVTALGELGGEEARAILRQLLNSSERDLVKAVASALYTAPVVVRQKSPSPDRPLTAQERMRGDAQPPFFISLEATLRALPDTQPCNEVAFSRRIAQVCLDYASVRRYLVEDGLVQRDGGIYRLTTTGEVAWRVERFLAA